MTKDELVAAVSAAKTETHDALQLIWDNTNKGQRNKMLKNPEIKELLERYEVDTGNK